MELLLKIRNTVLGMFIILICFLFLAASSISTNTRSYEQKDHSYSCIDLRIIKEASSPKSLDLKEAVTAGHFLGMEYTSCMSTAQSAAKGGGRAFFSGAGTEAKAIEQGFQTLGQTRAGQNLQNLITSKNIPWKGPGGAESMWNRLSATWAKGIPNGSSVPVFLNNPRAGSVWFQTEFPILQSKGVNLIYK